MADDDENDATDEESDDAEQQSEEEPKPKVAAARKAEKTSETSKAHQKKKKKKKKKTEASAKTDQPAKESIDSDAEAEDEDGAEKKPEPIPGEGTEEGEKLREAVAAFERGDYARVREITDALVDGSKEEAIFTYARELRRRTQVDPLQVGVVATCLALFLYIVYTYVLS